jgi:hypothetical protein
VADLELLTLNLAQMNIDSTEHQESTNPPLLIASVGGSLPFTDVLELNICIEKLNTKQITLEEFVSDVWNTAYRVGYDMASEQ